MGAQGGGGAGERGVLFTGGRVSVWQDEKPSGDWLYNDTSYDPWKH